MTLRELIAEATKIMRGMAGVSERREKSLRESLSAAESREKALRDAIGEADRAIVDAIDASDPVIFEKDWGLEKPTEAYVVVWKALNRARTLLATAVGKRLS